MKVIIEREAGYHEAVRGLSLSYGITFSRAIEVAERLCFKDCGENKFLESISVWLYVQAPRFWWQEADTYRVGATKQSESTMHTIHKRALVQGDFEHPIHQPYLEYLNVRIDEFKAGIITIDQLKNDIPEGFLQGRMWKVNYKTIRNMLIQRTTHRLPQWRQFCNHLRNNLEHPELLPIPRQENKQ